MKKSWKKILFMISTVISLLSVFCFFYVSCNCIGDDGVNQGQEVVLNDKGLLLEIYNNIGNFDYSEKFDELLGLVCDFEDLSGSYAKSKDSIELKENIESIKSKLSEFNLSYFDSLIKKQDFLGSSEYPLRKSIEKVRRYFDYVKAFEEEMKIFYVQELEIESSGVNRKMKVALTKEDEREKKLSDFNFISFSLPVSHEDEDVLKKNKVFSIFDESRVEQYPNLVLKIFDNESKALLFSNKVCKKRDDSGKLLWYSQGDVGNIDDSKTYSFKICEDCGEYCKSLFSTLVKFGCFENVDENFKKCSFEISCNRILKSERGN